MRGLRDACGERRIRFAGRGVDELDRHHGTAPADVADARVGRLCGGEPFDDAGLDRAGRSGQVVLLVRLDGGEGGDAGERVPAVGTAETASVRGVHDVGTTGHGRERQPASDALGGDDEVRDDTEVLGREHGTGAGEPGLHLVGDEDDVVRAGPVEQGGEEAVRRHDEAALALDGFDDDRRQVVRADLLLDLCDRPLRRLGAGQSSVTERVGEGRAVHLGGERPEAALVGHRLRGERHREVGAAVVGVVERDDRLLLRVAARDLDGVLDGFRTGVEQRRALRVVARGQPVQGFGDLDVGVVGGDGEAGVGELLQLAGHGFDHTRVAVADARHGDPGAEVDERVAVDVDEDATAGARCEDGHRGTDTGRDRGVFPGHELLGDRSGDGGDETTLLGE